jgi:hypothetical protein
MKQDNNTKRFTVWIGGIEATDNYLTRDQAETIAAEARANGYEDTAIEELKLIKG